MKFSNFDSIQCFKAGLLATRFKTMQYVSSVHIWILQCMYVLTIIFPKKKKAQIEKNKRNLAICCAKIAHATAGLLSSWKSQFSIELLYAFYHEDWLWTLASWWDDTILFFPPICLYVFFFKDDSDNSYSLSYC